MSIRSLVLFLASILCCTSLVMAKAWYRPATAIQGEVVSTSYSDSRYQTVIPRDELDNAFGTWTSLSLIVSNGTGYDLTNLTVRGKSATNNDLNTISGGSFVNNGLTTLFTGSISISQMDPDTWELEIPFNQSTITTSEYIGDGYLIDLVVDNTGWGSENTYFLMGSTSTGTALRVRCTSTLETFNYLNATTGTSISYRPWIKLHGINHEIRRTIYPGEFTEPLVADLLVKAGTQLELYHGTQLTFAEGIGMVVQGTLLVNGTPSARVDLGGDAWSGLVFEAESDQDTSFVQHAVIHGVDNTNGDRHGAVFVDDQDKLVMRDVEIANCSGTHGGGVKVYSSGALFERLYIHNCSSRLYGGGMYLSNANARVLDSRIEYNQSDLGGALYVFASSCELEGLVLRQNQANAGVAVYSFASYGDRFVNCTTIGSDTNSTQFMFYSNNRTTLLEGCLFLRSTGYSVASGIARAAISRCSSPDGTSDFYNCTILDGVIAWNGSFDYEKMCALNTSAAIVDAGPLDMLDADLTRKDIGAGYFDQSAPTVSQLVDVPADQGHQLQLAWEASSMDLAQANDDWFYSVWRLDSLFDVSRSAESIWLEDVSRLDPATIGDTPIRVTAPEGHVWTFVSQVPATQVAEYGLIVPTLHDMLDGQAWESEVLVYWHHDTELAESATATAISVDNIAPDAPMALAATAVDEELQLSWSEVTTGTLDGVTLPERNGIVYHIYASEVAWFELEDAEYIGTVSEPRITLPVEANTRRFYKIVASDSQ